MANFQALTLHSGVITLQQNGDTLIVGTGIDVGSSGALTIGSSTATSIALAQNTSISGSKTFSTGTGTVTINGSITTANNPNFDFSGSSGIFKTSTGTLTIEGSLTTANNPNFDFSGSSGTFKTSTGTLTIEGSLTTANNPNFDFSGSTGTFKTSTGTITVGGITTFTASGTALTVNNNATITGSATLGSALTTTVDTATATTLSIGTSTTSGISIGKSGITTTITGGLTQLTGAISLAGNAASSLTTSAGALTLTSAAAATWSTSAGALTVNGFAGINLQNNGTTNLAVGSGSLTVQTGITLGATGTGNINLPNTGLAGTIFQINGSSVDYRFTATNASTLVNGSNADALHFHSATGNITATGLTTTGVGDGYFGYMSGNSVVSLALADTLVHASVMGANQNVSGTMDILGAVSVFFETGLTLAAGNRVYLSAATSGMATNVAPSTVGQVVAKVGLIIDQSTYNSTQRAKIILQISNPVQL